MKVYVTKKRRKKGHFKIILYYTLQESKQEKALAGLVSLLASA